MSNENATVKAATPECENAPCFQSMGTLCAGHAAGLPSGAACDTTEGPRCSLCGNLGQTMGISKHTGLCSGCAYTTTATAELIELRPSDLANQTIRLFLDKDNGTAWVSNGHWLIHVSRLKPKARKAVESAVSLKAYAKSVLEVREMPERIMQHVMPSGDFKRYVPSNRATVTVFSEGPKGKTEYPSTIIVHYTREGSVDIGLSMEYVRLLNLQHCFGLSPKEGVVDDPVRPTVVLMPCKTWD